MTNRLQRFLGALTCRRRHVQRWWSYGWPVRVEIDCPGPTADFATVKVNGAALPLASLTLEIRYGEVNRVVMELQPEDVEIAVEAVPLLRRALDPSLVEPAPEGPEVA